MDHTSVPSGQLAIKRDLLRVAIVTETYPPEVNGVAMTIGRMADGLLRRGHDVHIVRPRQHADDVAGSGPRLRETLMRSVSLPRYEGLRMGLPASGRLVRLWQNQPPDIVHVVTEGPLGRSGIVAAHRLRIPASSDFHTNFHSYSKHYGFGLFKPLISAYLRRFHNSAACTFVPTRELKGQLADAGYRNLIVVARGADTTLFNPERRSDRLRAEWGVSDDDIVAIYVGRLAPEKNIPAVLAAFDEIRFFQRSARLVLVGDGPQRADLEMRYPEHRFAGMRHGEDLAAHFASGDVFLFPSVTETFGNVTVEAMASGLAVVAYDYAAAREHIAHRESGLLAPLHDETMFRQFAVEVAKDAALREQLRRNARLTAQRIAWDQVIDEFEMALLGAVEQARARA